MFGMRKRNKSRNVCITQDNSDSEYPVSFSVIRAMVMFALSGYFQSDFQIDLIRSVL